MAEHTPGPWNVSRRTLGILDITGYVPPNGDPDQVPLGRQFVALVDGLHPVGEANARLIAAAPELLETLRWFVNDDPCRLDHHGFCHSHDVTNCLNDEARAVILKAEGRQP